MNTATDWRLESAAPSRISSSAPVSAPDPSPRPEVSSMYSPASIAFFGVTGSAVGAAGLTGSFGGLTSLFVTAIVLATLFVSLLAVRALVRRRHGVSR
jgi:hypothetical protein